MDLYKFVLLGARMANSGDNCKETGTEFEGSTGPKAGYERGQTFRHWIVRLVLKFDYTRLKRHLSLHW